MGLHTTGSGVKKHISSEMAKDLNAKNPTVYHLWFLVYQRVLPRQHLQLLLHHLHHRSQHRLTEIQYQLTEMWKLQYQMEVEVRMRELRGDLQHKSNRNRKQQIKMVNQKKHKEIHRMNCLICYRNSRRIWSMKVLQQCLGENPEQGSQDTSSSSHELPMESRACVEPGSGKHSVFSHFPKDPTCDICVKTEITKVSCRRRAGTVVPRAEHFGDLITSGHKVLSEESESRNNHRYAVVVTRLGNTMDTIIPVQIKIFPRDPEEPHEVPGASKETKSHLY